MFAAPDLIAAAVKRLDASEGREKITREDFERKFIVPHSRILVSSSPASLSSRQIRDSHELNLGVKQSLA
jgi:hypothetical protein